MILLVPTYVLISITLYHDKEKEKHVNAYCCEVYGLHIGSDIFNNTLKENIFMVHIILHESSI